MVGIPLQAIMRLNLGSVCSSLCSLPQSPFQPYGLIHFSETPYQITRGQQLNLQRILIFPHHHSKKVLILVMGSNFEVTFVLEKHVVEDDVLFTNHLAGNKVIPVEVMECYHSA